MADGGWAVVKALSRKIVQLLPTPSPLSHDRCKMPPRGNEGLNFSPILTHYLFLFTSILSVVRIPCPPPLPPRGVLTGPPSQFGWFIAFISQAVATANR